MRTLTIYIKNGANGVTTADTYTNETYDFKWRFLGDRFIGILKEDKEANKTTTRLIPLDQVVDLVYTEDGIRDDKDSKYLEDLRHKAETEKDPKKFVAIANAALDFADILLKKDYILAFNNK